MNPATGQLLDLRDIHAAPPPGLWPPAPGWWLLALLLAVLAVLLLVRLRRLLRVRRFRRRVLQELEDIGVRCRAEDPAGLAAAVNTWLRRVALLRYPREQVASLTGNAWLEFLDATGGGGAFSGGAGRVLDSGPYSLHTAPAPREMLLALAREWAGRNLERLP